MSKIHRPPVNPLDPSDELAARVVDRLVNDMRFWRMLRRTLPGPGRITLAIVIGVVIATVGMATVSFILRLPFIIVEQASQYEQRYGD